MMEVWGPLITSQLIASGVFFAFLATVGWLSGHIVWLVLNGRKLPNWVFDYYDPKLIKQAKPHKIYVNKGIGWAINVFGVLWALWPYKSNLVGDTYPYKPVIGNIFLLNIGGVVFELILYLILTSFFQWVTQERKQ